MFFYKHDLYMKIIDDRWSNENEKIICRPFKFICLQAWPRSMVVERLELELVNCANVLNCASIATKN